MISLRTFIRSAAALCAIMMVGVVLAEDGVVRLSDRSSGVTNSSNGSGIVRMSDNKGAGIQRTSCSSAGACGDNSCSIQGCSPQCWTNGCVQNSCPCDPGCNPGTCQSGICYTPMDCNTCFSGCDASGMPLCWCSKCHCSPCQCGNMRGGQNDVCLFAGSVDSGTGSACRDFWHGQSMSFRNKNARLADHLFGWMIPSGCCGQGCPPVGKYGVTYANQPNYIDPRDTQVYAAQGYGMPMAVPLAPNVTHTYNYSSGLPASRVTHIGNYNPNTSLQPLYHQTW